MHRNQEINPEIHIEIQKTLNRQILSKKSSAGGVTIPNFKPYYRAITITKKHDTGTKTNRKMNGSE
jgi:hypothetical protein